MAEAHQVVGKRRERVHLRRLVLVAVCEFDEQVAPDDLQVGRLDLAQQELGQPHCAVRKQAQVQVARLYQLVHNVHRRAHVLVLLVSKLLARPPLQVQPNLGQHLGVGERIDSELLQLHPVRLAALCLPRERRLEQPLVLAPREPWPAHHRRRAAAGPLERAAPRGRGAGHSAREGR